MNMARRNRSNRRNRRRAFWKKICVDFYGRLTAYASRLANGKEYDALDLVQETVLRVLFYAPNPKKVQSPLGYLLTVMRHVWTDKWDREGTAKTTSLEQVGETKSPVEATVEPEVLRILENEDLLRQMSEGRGPLTSREELLLTKHLEGYTCAEIASMLDEDKRVTRTDINAVRVKVRQRLERPGARGRRQSRGRQ
jgi:DNA-directed RNA polymerase specialized sigma24 family protein